MKTRLNILDTVILSLLGLIVVGVLLVQSGSLVTSGAQVDGESDIQVLVGVYGAEIKDKTILKAGDDASLTVRNQPRGEVPIESVQWSRPKVTLMGAGGKPVTVDSIVREDIYDVYVTLKDHALVSKEGYVSNGVKLKVGQPIEIEGFAYRLSGKIVDVKKAERDSEAISKAERDSEAISKAVHSAKAS